PPPSGAFEALAGFTTAPWLPAVAGAGALRRRSTSTLPRRVPTLNNYRPAHVHVGTGGGAQFTRPRSRRRAPGGSRRGRTGRSTPASVLVRSHRVALSLAALLPAKL